MIPYDINGNPILDIDESTGLCFGNIKVLDFSALEALDVFAMLGQINNVAISEKELCEDGRAIDILVKSINQTDKFFIKKIIQNFQRLGFTLTYTDDANILRNFLKKVSLKEKITSQEFCRFFQKWHKNIVGMPETAFANKRAIHAIQMFSLIFLGHPRSPFYKQYLQPLKHTLMQWVLETLFQDDFSVQTLWQLANIFQVAWFSENILFVDCQLQGDNIITELCAALWCNDNLENCDDGLGSLDNYNWNFWTLPEWLFHMILRHKPNPPEQLEKTKPTSEIEETENEFSQITYELSDLTEQHKTFFEDALFLHFFLTEFNSLYSQAYFILRGKNPTVASTYQGNIDDRWLENKFSPSVQHALNNIDIHAHILETLNTQTPFFKTIFAPYNDSLGETLLSKISFLSNMNTDRAAPKQKRGVSGKPAIESAAQQPENRADTTSVKSHPYYPTVELLQDLIKAKVYHPKLIPDRSNFMALDSLIDNMTREHYGIGWRGNENNDWTNLILDIINTTISAQQNSNILTAIHHFLRSLASDRYEDVKDMALPLKLINRANLIRLFPDIVASMVNVYEKAFDSPQGKTLWHISTYQWMFDTLLQWANTRYQLNNTRDFENEDLFIAGLNVLDTIHLLKRTGLGFQDMPKSMKTFVISVLQETRPEEHPLWQTALSDDIGVRDTLRPLWIRVLYDFYTLSKQASEIPELRDILAGNLYRFLKQSVPYYIDKADIGDRQSLDKLRILNRVNVFQVWQDNDYPILQLPILIYEAAHSKDIFFREMSAILQNLDECIGQARRVLKDEHFHFINRDFLPIRECKVGGDILQAECKKLHAQCSFLLLKLSALLMLYHYRLYKWSANNANTQEEADVSDIAVVAHKVLRYGVLSELQTSLLSSLLLSGEFNQSEEKFATTNNTDKSPGLQQRADSRKRISQTHKHDFILYGRKRIPLMKASLVSYLKSAVFLDLANMPLLLLRSLLPLRDIATDNHGGINDIDATDKAVNENNTPSTNVVTDTNTAHEELNFTRGDDLDIQSVTQKILQIVQMYKTDKQLTENDKLRLYAMIHRLMTAKGNTNIIGIVNSEIRVQAKFIERFITDVTEINFSSIVRRKKISTRDRKILADVYDYLRHTFSVLDASAALKAGIIIKHSRDTQIIITNIVTSAIRDVRKQITGNGAHQSIAKRSHIDWVKDSIMSFIKQGFPDAQPLYTQHESDISNILNVIQEASQSIERVLETVISDKHSRVSLRKFLLSFVVKHALSESMNEDLSNMDDASHINSIINTVVKELLQLYIVNEAFKIVTHYYYSSDDG